MIELIFQIATKQDLSILNILYAEMDNKPLMAEEEIFRSTESLSFINKNQFHLFTTKSTHPVFNYLVIAIYIN